MTTPLFIDNPMVLIEKPEFMPTSNMTQEEKLNAITRTVIVLSVMGFIFTMKPRFLLVGLATCIIILFMRPKPVEEAFSPYQKRTPPIKMSDFKEGTKKNPFGNVLLTEIGDDPKRKSAPPAFNAKVDEEITKNVKKSVQFMNPEIKGASKQLYGDLWDKFELDQSNRQFFSTANTQVMADQAGFAKFLYGDMISSKETGVDSALARTQDNTRYRLY